VYEPLLGLEKLCARVASASASVHRRARARTIARVGVVASASASSRRVARASRAVASEP